MTICSILVLCVSCGADTPHEFGQCESGEEPFPTELGGGAEDIPSIDAGGDSSPIHIGDAGFVSVALGWQHSCGRRADKAVICWGRNLEEQTDALPGSFVEVSAGKTHTCGVRPGGEIQCWGTDEPHPSAEVNAPEGAFVQTSAGDDFTCALSDEQRIVCWGRNYAMQSEPPTGSFKQLSVGAAHGCAVTTDGQVECWGAGAQADERDTDSLKHRQAIPPSRSDFVQVASGWAHTCALSESHQVTCWGIGTDSRFEEDRRYIRRRDFDQATPPCRSFRQVAAGLFHTCGLTVRGAVQCWGAGSTPGRQNEGPADYDQAVAPEGSFVAVAAGGYHSCAVRIDGSIQCWGLGTNKEHEEAPGLDYDQAVPPDIAR